LVLWAAMELNLLIFLPTLVFSTSLFRGASGLKFFFIQSLRGLIVLVLSLVLMREADGAICFRVRGLLIMKIGGFPFHS